MDTFFIAIIFMPEFLFLFFLIFLLPFLFWILPLPSEYMEETFLVLACIIGIPFLFTLPSAPFVPSKKARVDTMLELANLNTKKTVYELGCGDGRVIRAAAKNGVKKAVAYDISIPLVLYAKFRVWLEQSNISVFYGTIWNKDYSDADILFMYLLPNVMPRVEKEIWSQLPKGSRLISNAFPMKGVKEDQKRDGVYLYIKK